MPRFRIYHNYTNSVHEKLCEVEKSGCAQPQQHLAVQSPMLGSGDSTFA